MKLSIDIETYSSVDLVKSGVYAYTAAPDFEILLFAYEFENAQPRIVDIANGEKLPGEIMAALTDENITKTAYNANFERTCIARFFKIECDPKQWECSAVHAAELGLPSTLAGVAKALGLSEQKDSRGKSLIAYFCKPCKPSKANEWRTRNLPQHARDKWKEFKEYCLQDVVVEASIRSELDGIQRLPKSEKRLWEADQRINDRGVGVDMELVDKAIELDNANKERLTRKAAEITGLENPNSVAQLKKWIERKTGVYYDSLNKEAVTRIIEEIQDNDVIEALKIRAKLGKTSVGKYKAIKRSVDSDGRIRGLLQFYGASRTGRWAGRIVQVQNLPQNHIADLGALRETVKAGDFKLIDMLYDNVSDVLSQLIRTALIPSKGRRFIVSDFSAIEARVIAWLAGEKWRVEVFKTHGKIYEASAAQMFKVPVEDIKKGSPLRQKGKIAELALGYGGGVGALISMGALKMGLEEDELKPLVDTWRQSNPAITRLWREIEKAAINATLDTPSRIYKSTLPKGLSFDKEAGILFVGLPSGRRLAYVNPEIRDNKFGRPALTYMGVSEGSWTRLETFGGKLTENIVQAIARDCLAESIIRLEKAGYELNFHVHDEVILDAPIGEGSAQEVAEIMGRPIAWAQGLPLKADAYECEFYKKE